jgi:hypothetical protein
VLRKLSVALFITLGLLAAGRAFAPYSSVKPLLSQGPAELQSADEAQWIAWARRHDKTIRARLEQGDLDSMVNLLLYGTSFTSQPRISMEGEGIAAASKSGVLRTRVDDLVAGLRSPGDNERLIFLQQVVKGQGIDPESSDGGRETGLFLLKNLQRVVAERKTLALRAADSTVGADDASSLLNRSSFFRDRGLSLDTGIIPDFSIEQTLRDLKARGVLRENQVSRVAVIGPGLDFIDKNEESAYDYYPQQTVQPFALYDSLVRLRLAKPGALSVAIFDISGRVIEHLDRARRHARKGVAYTLQLPRDLSRPWPESLVGYWKSLGNQIGTPTTPIPSPRIFPGLETRAVRIRPEVVQAFQPVDLDIIVERLTPTPAGQFDLIVATNIFVYYDAFEQSLALENAGAMLKTGALLLTNDRLPENPGGPMRLTGVTVIPFDTPGMSTRLAMGWYKRE